MPRRDLEASAGRPTRIMFRAKGGLLLASGLAAAPLTWIIGNLFVTIAEKSEVEVPPVARFCIEQRPVMVLIALTAAACGLGLLVTSKGRWLWLGIGLAALLIVVALVVLGLIGLLGPMYEYQELG